MTAGISVDLRSATPPYEQIRTQITSLVAVGALPPGTRLPTIRSLAADLGIAAGTVGRAYRELEQAGVITTGRRNGTSVAVPAAAASAGPSAKAPGRTAPKQPPPAHDAALIAAADGCIAAARAAGLDDEALVALVRTRLGRHPR
ncbi:GntR family transcriptional regulator [Arthrobacter sp. B3I4]|uniref:GntR family transcriptional regulator n=1 Tax=Arthrobacter sp. B3I4 TaxID=3042267 RepID=UPI002786B1FD|nr:GntR family transcriptional regulator [Arthrobacter sp. B3I4]MDQ0755437.1 GntR family transcriptional regulator [Arthrobacter sp. B3I4]